ncbi:hypothetical protein L7F22_006893 [Adiantum nelumboides]|nr:hypothetical protein [Adiantum nelumboides]
MPARPRVVVVGAGMAGLSAAHRLHQACREAFDLTTLEGSNRIGGRIQTSSLGGDQVELGATFIHGIKDSPVYDIAQRIGALSVDTPCENYENRFQNPLFRAEGTSLPVDPHLLLPCINLYRSSMALAKGKVAGQSLSDRDGSVGTFLRQRLRNFLSEQASTAENSQNILDTAIKSKEFSTEDGESIASMCEKVRDSTGQWKPEIRNAEARNVQRGRMRSIHTESEELTAQSQRDEGCAWPLKGGSEKKGENSDFWNSLLLQESMFYSLEALERSISASNSLDDLDLASLEEYTEFRGRHITIGKGYVSVLKELESNLPVGMVKFEKKVQKIFWNHSHSTMNTPVVLQCEDGSIVEADHVILTMSLGVLKAGVSLCAKQDLSSICRSVLDLRGWKALEEAPANELFEPLLPCWKLNAISCLGFGVVNKLFLLLDPAADKRLLTEITFLHHKSSESVPGWLKKTFAMFPIYNGSNVVVFWLTGEEALQMETLLDEEVLDGVAQLLTSFRIVDEGKSLDMDKKDADAQKTGESKQKLRHMFKGVLRSKWATNPLSQGSYSFVAVGSSGKDIDNLARPLPEINESGEAYARSNQIAMHSPLQLLFAGEATHRSFYSTTHGAFLSGIREAKRLLEFFKNGN